MTNAENIFVKLPRPAAEQLLADAPPYDALRSDEQRELRLALAEAINDDGSHVEAMVMLSEALRICQAWSDRNEDARAAASLIADARDRLR